MKSLVLASLILIVGSTAWGAEKKTTTSKYETVLCDDLLLEPDNYVGKRIEASMEFSLRWQDGNVQFKCLGTSGYIDASVKKLPKEDRRWLLSLTPGRDSPILKIRGRFAETDSLDYIIVAESIEK